MPPNENAKQEFLTVIKEQNKQDLIKCVQIETMDMEVDRVIELPVDYTTEQFIKFLADLDFDYDDSYGAQHLDGTIWLKDGTWFERFEYDGAECWVFKQYPAIPTELSPKK